jgi:pimeloyl-ACP methyl ester carboxylesterase
MRISGISAFFLTITCAASIGLGQAAAPPAPPVPRSGPMAAPRAATHAYIPTDAELQPIKDRLAQLNAAIADLKASNADDDLVVDAEAYAWVVNNVVRVPGAFIEKTYVNRCMSVLADGLRRAQQIKDGKGEWPKMTGSLHRGYRSVVDGTAQPYQITIPASYDPSKPTPLYVYLHGRSQFDPDMGLGEVGGSDQARVGGGRARNAPASMPNEPTVGGEAIPPGEAGGVGGGGGGGGGRENYIRVNAFGRANNSYRWAGETDIYEVIASVSKRYNIDPDRIILAGFSLGGAGSWQIGLHHPDMFCGLEVDAGVIGNRHNLDGLTPAQKAAQSTYGIMIDHALNVWNVPLVAYAGANDAQLLSSTNIRQQLTAEGYTIDQLSTYVGKGRDINALFLATPRQGHSHATGETLRLINEFNAANFKRGRVVPDHIKFITYTTRYNTDYWITVDGLIQHYNRAKVDAQRDAAKSSYTIQTANVSSLVLSDMSAATSITIDGDALTVTPSATIRLALSGGHWQVAAAPAGLRKQHGLQGPINDAFMDAFLCVSPSGQGFSPAADERAAQEMDRFAKMFTREYLGEARTKADSAITAEDIANNNLVLFGDPASNSIIARIADQLPIKWTRDSIVVADKTYSASDHVPVLIYPNPLNPRRYVVINTGLVSGNFNSSAAYGDYAVLKLTKPDSGPVTTQITDGGAFDESWQLPAAH